MASTLDNERPVYHQTDCVTQNRRMPLSTIKAVKITAMGTCRTTEVLILLDN